MTNSSFFKCVRADTGDTTYIRKLAIACVFHDTEEQKVIVSLYGGEDYIFQEDEALEILAYVSGARHNE